MKKTDLTRNVIGYTDGERGRQECLTIGRQRSQKTNRVSGSLRAVSRPWRNEQRSRRTKRVGERSEPVRIISRTRPLTGLLRSPTHLSRSLTDH